MLMCSAMTDVTSPNGVVQNGKYLANGHAKPLNKNGYHMNNNDLYINGQAFVSKHDLDQVKVAENFTTCRADEAVKLRMTETGYGSETPRTVPSLFRETAERVGDKLALVVKRDNQWIHWTWHQYHLDIMRAAKSFIKLGLEPFCSVGIIGFNSPEWFISDLGAIFAGGLAVGFYTTSTPDAIKFVAQDAQCNIIVVENNVHLQKILEIRHLLPKLKAIVQYSGELSDAYPGVYGWEDFMACGKSVSFSELDARLRLIAPNKCCTLIYTSGTTGTPKGVMVSHDNFIWTATQCIRSMGVLEYGNEIGISFLPLSHVAAQLLDIHIPMSLGCTVYFAQPDALKGSLVDTLKEVRPTVFLGVPRVWEKIHEKMAEIGRNNTGIKKKIGDWAKSVGLRANYAKMNGDKVPWNFSIANGIIFKKVKAALGLDRCKLFMTAAAPIMRKTLDYFLSLNMPIYEIYGMSESSGPHTISNPNAFRVTSVGQEFTGAITKLYDQDADGNGEICMFGRHVCMGYLNQEEKTRKTIDADGYLHSEDIGRKDQDGFIYITGRIKELLITAGGENIAPVPIEEAVKESLPCVSNCMLIGDKKKFLLLLIALKTEVNAETTEPTDQLAYDSKRFCEEHGCDFTTLTEVMSSMSKDSPLHLAIQEGINNANKKAVSNAARIAKWTLLPRDFSIPGGELGPTLKIKRPVVVKMYEQLIDSHYGD